MELSPIKLIEMSPSGYNLHVHPVWKKELKDYMLKVTFLLALTGQSVMSFCFNNRLLRSMNEVLVR